MLSFVLNKYIYNPNKSTAKNKKQTNKETSWQTNKKQTKNNNKKQFKKLEGQNYGDVLCKKFIHTDLLKSTGRRSSSKSFPIN